MQANHVFAGIVVAVKRHRIALFFVDGQACISRLLLMKSATVQANYFGQLLVLMLQSVIVGATLFG